MPTALPPRAARRPHHRHHHGHHVVDDYEWLRDKDNPETLAYLTAENAYAETVTAPQESLREQIFEEIRSRTKETDMSVPVRHQSWWNFTRTTKGQSYVQLCRVPARPAEEPGAWEPPTIQPGVPLPQEEVILDCNQLAQGHEFFSLGGCALNDQGNYLVYGVDVTGDERYTLRVKDLRTGELLDDCLTNTGGGALLTEDEQYIFYTLLDDTRRSASVWRHQLGTPQSQDTCVYEEKDERFWVSLSRSRDRSLIVIGAASSLTSEYWWIDADDYLMDPVCVRPRETGVEYHWDSLTLPATDTTPERTVTVVLHNTTSPNFALSLSRSLDLTQVEHLGDLPVLVPPSEGRRLDDVVLFEHALVVGYRENALRRIALFPVVEDASAANEDTEAGIYGEPHEIGARDEVLSSLYLSGNPDWQAPMVRFQHASFTTLPYVADYSFDDGSITIRRRAEIEGGYCEEDYTEERLWAPARDGHTQIPISLIRRRDTDRHIPAPLLLYGYGAYEYSIDASFSVKDLSLLDRGMSLAIAHVRGGGEMGRHWYDDGKMEHKTTTFTDFIDCAQYLCDQGYTAPHCMVAQGGSAGGLLMGAVANMAPELFCGIVAEVPFVDPLTSMLMPELPLTANEWEEWGNPLDDPQCYKLMASYSPYENVDALPYPAMLVTTSLNDTRVLYVEPAKWVARLRAVAGETFRGPLVLKTEMNAGHGGVSGRYDAWREYAYSMAWILTQAIPDLLEKAPDDQID